MQNAIRIVLVDDNTLFRHGLKKLLQNAPNLDVVGDAESAEEAIVLSNQLMPDVVVTDLVLGRMSGIELIRQLRRDEAKGPRVVAMSAHSEAASIAEAAAAGACAFVSKLVMTDEIVNAIRRTVSDERCSATATTGKGD